MNFSWWCGTSNVTEHALSETPVFRWPRLNETFCSVATQILTSATPRSSGIIA